MSPAELILTVAGVLVPVRGIGMTLFVLFGVHKWAAAFNVGGQVVALALGITAAPKGRLAKGRRGVAIITARGRVGDQRHRLGSLIPD